MLGVHSSRHRIHYHHVLPLEREGRDPLECGLVPCPSCVEGLYDPSGAKLGGECIGGVDEGSLSIGTRILG